MDINTLKSWFQKGFKPTQEQFWSLIDSFRHKDDPVQIYEVDGLPGMLAGKADQGHKHTLADITDYNEEKEVLNGLLAMEASELEALPRTDGMYYIVLSDDTLYRCAYNEDTEEYNLEQVSPSSRVIYSVKDSEGSMRIYLFSDNQGVFQDVTGEVVDKTIYVQSLDELIGKELSDGVFTISHVTEDNDNSVYVMTVSGQSRVLESKDGWAHVSDGAWSWKKYAYEGHGHEIDDVNGLRDALANAGGKVDVDSELSDTSENPVQNKVIAEALKNAGSKVEVDTELSGSSENPVQNKVIHAAMEQKQSVSDNSLQTNAKTIPAAINEVLQKTVDFNKSYDINFEGKDSTMATETQYKKTGIVIKRIQTLNVGSLTLAIINNGYQTLSLTDGGIDPVTKLKIAYWEPEEGENGISAAYLAQLIWTISKVNTSTIAGISIYYE